MAKIFLIGGAGFIGAQMTKELLAAGDEVVIYDAFLNFLSSFNTNYPKYLLERFKDTKDKVTFIRGDMRHRGHLVRTLREYQPEIIVLLAAVPIATESNKNAEEAKTINLDGPINVLEVIRDCPFVKRFVYASSSMVYGDFNYFPCDEEHPTSPIDVYGGTKLAAEILIKAYGKRYGIEWSIVRPSAVYGPTDSNRRVSQIFVENALKGKKLVLHGGGESKLDFTYIEDIAHGFILAAKSPKAAYQIFNITAGEGRSLKEYVDILSKYVPDIQVTVEPADEKRPERGSLSIAKARRLLGYEPKYNLEKGLPLYVEFVKKMMRKENRELNKTNSTPSA